MEGVHNLLAVACQSKPPHEEASASVSHPTEQPEVAAQFATSEASATEAKDWKEEGLGEHSLGQTGVSWVCMGKAAS